MELILFPPGFGEPTGSPFAVKAWILLAKTGAEFTVSHQSDPRKMPKGKMPVLKVDGKMIPDSAEIRTYLEDRFSIDFDAGLSDASRAASQAVIRMVEEHLYFALLSDRWQQETHWPHVREEFFAEIPSILRGFISGMVRKGTLAQIKAQGMGRHSYAEQIERARADMAAISVLLGDQDFLFGETPTAADYSVVPILRCFTGFTIETPMGAVLREFPNLGPYLARGVKAFYP